MNIMVFGTRMSLIAAAALTSFSASAYVDPVNGSEWQVVYDVGTAPAGSVWASSVDFAQLLAHAGYTASGLGTAAGEEYKGPEYYGGPIADLTILGFSATHAALGAVGDGVLKLANLSDGNIAGLMSLQSRTVVDCPNGDWPCYDTLNSNFAISGTFNYVRAAHSYPGYSNAWGVSISDMSTFLSYDDNGNPVFGHLVYTPAVPEPEAAFLVLTVLPLIWAQRRRSKQRDHKSVKTSAA